MAQSRPVLDARRLVCASLAIALLATLVPLAVVSAAPSVSPALGGGSISSDLAGGASFVTLAGPVITEGGTGAFVNGSTIVLNVPAGFAFKSGSGSVTASGAGCNIGTSGPVVTGGTATLTITAASTVSTCVLTFSGLQVQPTSGTPLATGNITNSGTSAAPGGNYGTLTEVAGAPFVVSFTGQPTSSTGGVAFATQPLVHVVDKSGNPVPNASVALTPTPGTGAPTGSVTCTTNPAFTNAAGDALFAGCAIDVAANNYQLRATTGAVHADSTAFNVTVGPAHHLVFASYPAATTQVLLSPQPTVRVVDAGGNLVASATNSITLSTNQNNAQFTCSGGKTRAAVGGTATFTGCSESVVATGYTLSAAASGLTGVTGSTFTVSSGTATKLAICWGTAAVCNTVPPATIQGGTAFTVQPVIRVLDVNGNIVASDNTTVVTIGILAGTPTAGGPGTLTCASMTGTVTAGSLALSNCKIDKAGTGYRLNATATGLTAAQTASFNVAVGPAVKLSFVTPPPASATAGAPFPSNVQVGIADAGGNVVPSGITATISLSLGVNPTAALLTCTGGNAVATVNGVATFTGCTINKQGTGYTLVASASAVVPPTTLANVTSAAFNVLAPAAAIALSAPAVITWGQDMTLAVHFGANGANKPFTLQVSKDGRTWSNISGASLTTNGAGDASFIYGPSDNRYYRASFGGTPDLQAGVSNVVRTVVRQISLIRPAATSFYRTITHGNQITFTATIRPNRPELPQATAHFVIYQLQPSGWTQVLDRLVPVSRSNGVATLQVTFNSTGKFYVRSQAIPTPFNANSVWSPLARYQVR